MSTRNKPSDGETATVTTRIRSTSKRDAEKAVMLKNLSSSKKLTLPRFLSDTVDAATAPILEAAGVASSRQPRKAKVTK